jgi:hypothetical protein
MLVMLGLNRASAVGVLAMADGMNMQDVTGFFGETDAVIADAEAQLAGLSLEPFSHHLRRSLQTDGARQRYAWRCPGPSDECRCGRVRTKRSSARLTFLLLQIVRGEAEVGEHFFVRNSLTAATLEPILGFGDDLTFLVGLRLIVNGSVRDGAGDGIEHGFEQADDGGNLARGQAFDQLMGLVFFAYGTICHRESPELRVNEDRMYILHYLVLMTVSCSDTMQEFGNRPLFLRFGSNWEQNPSDFASQLLLNAEWRNWDTNGIG